MKQMPTKIIQPLKEFAFGFLGWFIIANIVFWAIAIMTISVVPSINGFSFILVGIWIPTVTVLIILFAKKRIWGGVGTLAAVTINTIIVGASSHFSRVTLAPFPSVYIVMVIAAIESLSPPPSSWDHLADFLFK